MNNQVAAPCCGSCEHWSDAYGLCGQARRLPVRVTRDGYFCKGVNYTPRNPIPIIELPGVKEMVEASFREGLHYGFEEDGDYPAPLKVDQMVSEYMEALEAK